MNKVFDASFANEPDQLLVSVFRRLLSEIFIKQDNGRQPGLDTPV